MNGHTVMENQQEKKSLTNTKKMPGYCGYFAKGDKFSISNLFHSRYRYCPSLRQPEMKCPKIVNGRSPVNLIPLRGRTPTHTHTPRKLELKTGLTLVPAKARFLETNSGGNIRRLRIFPKCSAAIFL